MRLLVLAFAAATALAACGNGSTDTGVSESDTASQQLEAGANSFTEDQARNRLITLGYAAPTTMTMTESGAWRAVTRDPSGNAVTVLIDYRGNVTADPSAAPSGQAPGAGGASTGTAPSTGTSAPGSSGSGSSGSGANSGGGQSSPAPSGGGATPSQP